MHNNYVYLNFVYSLFRTEEVETAENMFIVFQERVPLFIKTSKEVSFRCNIIFGNKMIFRFKIAIDNKAPISAILKMQLYKIMNMFIINVY